MAGSGLIALLDDVATLADDVATLTVAAGKKTTGLVTDDMAVTAEQTLGIARAREIPMVLKVARGSMFNKAVVLAPGALFLNWIAPWTIGPILMAGGLYLSFEGVEKILHKFLHSDDPAHTHEDDPTPADPEAFERMRVKGAIRTDLILSAEIVAITLGEVTTAPFWTQVAVLYIVSVAITVGVYGLVMGLVKIDDVGAAMARREGSVASLGRGIVVAAPWLLTTISWVGTVAMLIVGGHILLEGIAPLEHFVHDLLHDAPGWVSPLANIAVGAAFGLATVGVMATGLPQRLWRTVRGG